MTILNNLKATWSIKKKDLKNLGIDPNKEWILITLIELIQLSIFLDVRVSDLID